jgi:holo-[acyl-carrier protein] synthase
MKILGVGVDIIDNSRIKKLLKDSRFIKRIFTSSEILQAKKINDKTLHYSKRYAAKEAFSKSLGTGFRDGLNFKDVSITNNKLGKPSFIINNKIKQLIKKQFNTSRFNFFLSISDEKKYSIAYVVLQKNENK